MCDTSIAKDRSASFMRTPLCPAVDVLPGEVAWRRFVVTANGDELAVARAGLKTVRLLGTRNEGT